MGSGGAVEVPRRGRRRPRRGAPRRRGCHPGACEHALRPRWAGAPAPGALRRGGRPAPDRGRRRPRRPAARRRRRPGSRGDLHGAELPRLGRGDHRRRLRGPGQHPRLGGDGHRPRANVRDNGRQAARRTPPRRAHGSAGSGRRPPGAAVGRAPRRPQGRRLHGHDGRGCRSARRRSPHADRGASPDLRHARPPLRRDTRRGVARRGRADRTRAPRAARRARLRRRGPRARLPRLGGHGEPRRTREGDRPHRPRRPRASYASSPRRRRRRKRRAESGARPGRGHRAARPPSAA